MTDLTIHGFAPSTYTRTARMAAIELGAEHELKPVAFGKPEHLELHPFGKMPILTNGEDTIFETLAILTYLDQTFDEGRLFPADSLVQNLGMISAANDYAYRSVVHIKAGNEQQLAAANRFFDSLERVLQQSAYCSGQVVGAADLFIAPMLDYHIAEIGSDHVWLNRPKLEAWFNTIRQRQSFVETGAN
jgi:glutathione S-transferase